MSIAALPEQGERAGRRASLRGEVVAYAPTRGGLDTMRVATPDDAKAFVEGMLRSKRVQFRELHNMASAGADTAALAVGLTLLKRRKEPVPDAVYKAFGYDNAAQAEKAMQQVMNGEYAGVYADYLGLFYPGEGRNKRSDMYRRPKTYQTAKAVAKGNVDDDGDDGDEPDEPKAVDSPEAPSDAMRMALLVTTLVSAVYQLEVAAIRHTTSKLVPEARATVLAVAWDMWGDLALQPMGEYLGIAPDKRGEAFRDAVGRTLVNASEWTRKYLRVKGALVAHPDLVRVI